MSVIRCVVPAVVRHQCTQMELSTPATSQNAPMETVNASAAAMMPCETFGARSVSSSSLPLNMDLITFCTVDDPSASSVGSSVKAKNTHEMISGVAAWIENTLRSEEHTSELQSHVNLV